jgi:hypothetical protein
MTFDPSRAGQFFRGRDRFDSVLPMPEVPPVTSATLSESFFVFIQLLSLLLSFLKARQQLHFFEVWFHRLI